MSERGSLFRWFRAGEAAPSPVATPRGGEDAGLARFTDDNRRDLLETISTFLLDNELAVNPTNLALAWQAFSGASPSLFRRIARQSPASGEPITQHWLDEITAAPATAQAEEDLRAMFDELDKGVRQFTRSASAARSATSDYQTDLGQHLAELEEAGQAIEMVSRLTSLARAMAERTRHAEAELQAREQEAQDATPQTRQGPPRRRTGSPDRAAQSPGVRNRTRTPIRRGRRRA